MAADPTPVDTSPKTVPALIPARMLNEFAYCPRLAWLEWVQAEWEESSDTVEGQRVHRRVTAAEGPRAVLHQRSLHLSSESLHLTAIVDFIESDGKRVRPVEYKKGKKPPVAGGAWEPEKVQLCAQGLLLREQGYECNEGVLYFAASRERVRVRFTPQLVTTTLAHIQALRDALERGVIPPPLEDSPKCPRCSLVSICLPEEVNFLRRGGEVRPIAVRDRGTFPLVVQEPGAYVRLCGSRLRVVQEGKELASVPLISTSHVVLMGGAHASGPVFRECCQSGIPIVHMSGSGWLNGMTVGSFNKNIDLRIEQFAAGRDEERRIAIARALVAAKIQNGRVLLRRNGSLDDRSLEILRSFAADAASASTIEELLGIEGCAARLYYSLLPTCLKGDAALTEAFDLDGRNRRPPRDPMNALLSFTYALLTKDWMVALQTVGFDPLLGFYHRTRHGKPALALDMMEAFRPVIADSVAVGAVNNGEVQPRDFYVREGAVLLSPAGRKRLLESYERRLATVTEHPLFGYRCTYRRIFELEARLLARHVLGEIPAYQPFRIR